MSGYPARQDTGWDEQAGLGAHTLHGKIRLVRSIPPFSLVLKTLRELGPAQLGLYALYWAGLKSGYFRRQTPAMHNLSPVIAHRLSSLRPVFDLPNPADILLVIGDEGLAHLKAEADEIVNGSVRLFGGTPVPLVLTLPGEHHHWTAYETGQAPIPQLSNSQTSHAPSSFDVKFIWEPARFGWAFTLCCAYYLTGDERYPAAFWRYFEVFNAANPTNLGPNWISAQEVALRILAFTFAAQIFAHSPHSTTTRHSNLALSVASHATRIPPTLIYARAQNNNHLLSEAAGLITASLVLPDHPQAGRWSNLGWKWFNRGLQSQISKDGTYIQQSTNYHRLMLQLALWVTKLRPQGSDDSGTNKQRAKNLQTISHGSNHALVAATRWLLALTDPDTGRVPNLGPNDGAYILPLTVLPFHDFRPVLQAAARTYLGQPAFKPGPWDEMSLWMCKDEVDEKRDSKSRSSRPVAHAPCVLHSTQSWGYLRAAHFNARPGHADQLHLDMWWRGLNIVQDAGTYLYTADPPWDNALTHTAVHNTVVVDGGEQMTRAGRFLYLDWAQAEIVTRSQAEDGSWEQVVARHDGYRRSGVIHQRSVTAFADNRWSIEDRILSARGAGARNPHTARLHWLLPDWEIQDLGSATGSGVAKVSIQSPLGPVRLAVGIQPSGGKAETSVIRAGELVYGSGPVSPTWGWVSPTYGVKIPAISFAVIVTARLPIIFHTEIMLPS